MEGLSRREWGGLQILFEGASCDWENNLREAVKHPYKPGQALLADVSEKEVSRKLTSPLFAVSIRIFGCNQTVYQRLLGWANQYTAPPQSLIPVSDSKDDEDDHY